MSILENNKFDSTLSQRLAQLRSRPNALKLNQNENGEQIQNLFALMPQNHIVLNENEDQSFPKEEIEENQEPEPSIKKSEQFTEVDKNKKPLYMHCNNIKNLTQDSHPQQPKKVKLHICNENCLCGKGKEVTEDVNTKKSTKKRWFTFSKMEKETKKEPEPENDENFKEFLDEKEIDNITFDDEYVCNANKPSPIETLAVKFNSKIELDCGPNEDEGESVETICPSCGYKVPRVSTRYKNNSCNVFKQKIAQKNGNENSSQSCDSTREECVEESHKEKLIRIGKIHICASEKYIYSDESCRHNNSSKGINEENPQLNLTNEKNGNCALQDPKDFSSIDRCVQKSQLDLKNAAQETCKDFFDCQKNPKQFENKGCGLSKHFNSFMNACVSKHQEFISRESCRKESRNKSSENDSSKCKDFIIPSSINVNVNIMKKCTGTGTKTTLKTRSNSIRSNSMCGKKSSTSEADNKTSETKRGVSNNNTIVFPSNSVSQPNETIDAFSLLMKNEMRHNFRHMNNILNELEKQKIEIEQLKENYWGLRTNQSGPSIKNSYKSPIKFDDSKEQDKSSERNIGKKIRKKKDKQVPQQIKKKAVGVQKNDPHKAQSNIEIKNKSGDEPSKLSLNKPDLTKTETTAENFPKTEEEKSEPDKIEKNKEKVTFLKGKNKVERNRTPSPLGNKNPKGKPIQTAKNLKADIKGKVPVRANIAPKQTSKKRRWLCLG